MITVVFHVFKLSWGSGLKHHHLNHTSTNESYSVRYDKCPGWNKWQIVPEEWKIIDLGKGDSNEKTVQNETHREKEEFQAQKPF